MTIDRDLAAIPPALAAFHPHRDGPRRLTFRYQPSQTRIGALLAALQATGATVLDLSTEESDLEDIFLELTRRPADGRERRMIARRRLLALLTAAAIASCAPRLAPMGPVTGEPRLMPDSVVMADGTRAAAQASGCPRARRKP